MEEPTAGLDHSAGGSEGVHGHGTDESEMMAGNDGAVAAALLPGHADAGAAASGTSVTLAGSPTERESEEVRTRGRQLKLEHWLL